MQITQPGNPDHPLAAGSTFFTFTFQYLLFNVHIIIFHFHFSMVFKVLFFVLRLLVRQCKSPSQVILITPWQPAALFSLSLFNTYFSMFTLLFFTFTFQWFSKFCSLFWGCWCGSANHPTRWSWSAPGSRQHCCESSFFLFHTFTLSFTLSQQYIWQIT